MEILSWLFTFFLKKTIVFKYLLIQRLILIVILITILNKSFNILPILILLRMGVPPFHIWAIHIYYFLKKETFLFITTIHKIIPFLILKRVLTLSLLFILIILRVATAFLILEVRDFYSAIIVSSIRHSFWLLFCVLIQSKLFYLYFIVYRIVISIFIRRLSTKNLIQSNNHQNTATTIIWLVLSGLPPFRVFWLKVSLLIVIVWTSTTFSLFLLITAVVRLFVYFRIFHCSIRTPFLQISKQTALIPIIGILGL